MKTLPDSLSRHLLQDATTICHAWRVTRRDGRVLGFTDHDRDLIFDGTTFQAASGFQASEAEQVTGLAAGSGEISGGFSSTAITEEDVAAGRFDEARVEEFSVNWADPSSFVRIRVNEIGEVVRAEGYFKAELRSLAARLDQPQGRVYGHRCDADFGDRRCGINAGLPIYKRAGTVLSVPDPGRLRVSGLNDVADGFFRFGRLTFLTGAQSGRTVDVDTNRQEDGQVTISLWLPLTPAPSVGDTFSVQAGCDKSFATCRTRFNNALNFQGFPHLPGTDFSYSYADGLTVHDGRPLYE
jgi:uncharacterized phage protein (TIGR02218 family)